MSTATLEQVIQRAIDDSAFRKRLGDDASAALHDYELTADERDAVTAGDETKLRALGVEARLSKALRHGG
jgi:hypothetical protein